MYEYVSTCVHMCLPCGHMCLYISLVSAIMYSFTPIHVLLLEFRTCIDMELSAHSMVSHHCVSPICHLFAFLLILLLHFGVMCLLIL